MDGWGAHHSHWESGHHPSRQGDDAVADGDRRHSSLQDAEQQLQKHQAYEEGRGLRPQVKHEVRALATPLLR